MSPWGTLKLLDKASLHYFSLCVFKCLLKLPSLVDFSPLCISKCTRCIFKWLISWVSQQSYFVSPICVSKCLLKLPSTDSHWFHSIDFFPLCIFKCALYNAQSAMCIFKYDRTIDWMGDWVSHWLFSVTNPPHWIWGDNVANKKPNLMPIIVAQISESLPPQIIDSKIHLHWNIPLSNYSISLTAVSSQRPTS